MSLRDIWRAAFASGEAFGHRHGLLLRTDFAEALDDAREEREARIRVEAYAAGREAGVEACAQSLRTQCAQARAQGRRDAVRETEDAEERARFQGRTEAFYTVEKKAASMIEGAAAIGPSPLLAVIDSLRSWAENEREVSARRARPVPGVVVPIRGERF